MSEEVAETLAQLFHETYERLAPSFGYKTREASAVPWEQVPEGNRQLIIAVCKEILDGNLGSALAPKVLARGWAKPQEMWEPVFILGECVNKFTRVYQNEPECGSPVLIVAAPCPEFADWEVIQWLQ